MLLMTVNQVSRESVTHFLFYFLFYFFKARRRRRRRRQRKDREKECKETNITTLNITVLLQNIKIKS